MGWREETIRADLAGHLTAMFEVHMKHGVASDFQLGDLFALVGIADKFGITVPAPLRTIYDTRMREHTGLGPL